MSAERIGQNIDDLLTPRVDGDVYHIEKNELPSGMSIANIDTLGYVPDFSEIINAIRHEPKTLLQPSLESLSASFRGGKSVLLMDGERPVGHVKLSLLLDPEKKRELDLPEDFPDIGETGTAIIFPEYRGHGYYPKIRTELLSMFTKDIKEKRLLVLGTTKNPRVIESLDDYAEKTGIEFSIVNRSVFSSVMAHTCVCKGEFGSGYQFGSECHQAPTASQLIQIEAHNWNAVRINGNGKIPCSIYVSDLDLTRELEERLLEHFGTQENVVSALKRLGQYDD